MNSILQIMSMVTGTYLSASCVLLSSHTPVMEAPKSHLPAAVDQVTVEVTVRIDGSSRIRSVQFGEFEPEGTATISMKNFIIAHLKRQDFCRPQDENGEEQHLTVTVLRRH